MTEKEVMTVRNKRLIPFLLVLVICAVFLPVFAIPARADEFGFVYTNPDTGYVIYIADEENLCQG